jgi:GTP-binding protein Era
MNRYMNRAATSSIEDVELILFLVEANAWTEEDENVLQRLKTVKAPVVLVVNKIDRIKDKEELFPVLEELSKKMEFATVIPLSALKGSNIKALEKLVNERMPVGEPVFPEDYVTDRSERFLAAELIREKLMRGLGKELPYSTTVEIESFKHEKGMLRIHALIWVERDSQKRIVIGKGGEKLKEVGQQSRLDMERLFDSKVFLQLWVKVKEGWSDNERLLNSLGYKDEF